MGLFDRLRRREPAEEPDDDEADEPLRLEELSPGGGSWSGLLFDNPSMRLDARLTWTFEFEFGEVERDYGATDVSLTVDWVPLAGAAWNAMSGQEAACDEFGEPIETSAYFFEHHRYDGVRLRILEQDGARIRVAVEATGDIDRLGIPRWEVDQWLEFAGIGVDVSSVRTLDDAEALLGGLTDIRGLEGRGSSGSFRFRIAHPSEPDQRASRIG